jgi:hypothetical protein
VNISNEQLRLIFEVFERAKRDNKFIFLKGGWNIDLSYGKVTREHDDIDFHYDISDYDYWKPWFERRGFKEEVRDEFYSIYSSPVGFYVDMGGFKYDPQTKKITWKHGVVSDVEDVVEDKEYKGESYLGMRLGVEKYLKLKHEDFGTREKDLHDSKILDELLGES